QAALLASHRTSQTPPALFTNGEIVELPACSGLCRLRLYIAPRSAMSTCATHANAPPARSSPPSAAAFRYDGRYRWCREGADIIRSPSCIVKMLYGTQRGWRHSPANGPMPVVDARPYRSGRLSLGSQRGGRLTERMIFVTSSFTSRA